MDRLPIEAANSDTNPPTVSDKTKVILPKRRVWHRVIIPQTAILMSYNTETSMSQTGWPAFQPPVESSRGGHSADQKVEVVTFFPISKTILMELSRCKGQFLSGKIL